MPIHEYVCQGCRHPFETFVRHPGEVVSCPECGQEKLQKKMSVFGARSATPAPTAAPAPGGGGCGCGNPHGPCRN